MQIISYLYFELWQGTMKAVRLPITEVNILFSSVHCYRKMILSNGCHKEGSPVSDFFTASNLCHAYK